MRRAVSRHAKAGGSILGQGGLREGIDAGGEAGDFEEPDERAAGFVEDEAGAEDKIFGDLDNRLFPNVESRLAA